MIKCSDSVMLLVRMNLKVDSPTSSKDDEKWPVCDFVLLQTTSGCWPLGLDPHLVPCVVLMGGLVSTPKWVVLPSCYYLFYTPIGVCLDEPYRPPAVDGP